MWSWRCSGTGRWMTPFTPTCGLTLPTRRCVLGVAVGASETEAFWVEFCRQLVARGLRGVQLVISDAHEGLRSALAQCFAGASWQRCTVHFQRNVMAACWAISQALGISVHRSPEAPPEWRPSWRCRRQVSGGRGGKQLPPSQSRCRLRGAGRFPPCRRELVRRHMKLRSRRTTPA